MNAAANADSGAKAPEERYQAIHLEAVLEEQGRKRRWLAERVGVSESLISHVLAGRHTVDRALGDAISVAVGVPFFVLFALRGRSETEPSAEDAA